MTSPAVESRSTPAEIKQQVSEFYNSIGWKEVGEGVYQNAHYEDLRPVAREYIHRCHLRLLRHLRPVGRYFLDAGSGPLQYPEYLEYSRGYQRRVCVDISLVALQEARKRLGERLGWYVVADIANLPFRPEVFDGAVSLHTIHHLPPDEHLQAYHELYRVLTMTSTACVVNGWPSSRLMRWFDPVIKLSNRLRNLSRRLRAKALNPASLHSAILMAPAHRTSPSAPNTGQLDPGKPKKGTFTGRHDVAWLYGVVGAKMPVAIYVWRSISVRFLRALAHTWLGGRYWLRLLFWLEDRYPRWFGENGQYPLIVIRKGSMA